MEWCLLSLIFLWVVTALNEGFPSKDAWVNSGSKLPREAWYRLTGARRT